jgi:hypothetical protein
MGMSTRIKLALVASIIAVAAAVSVAVIAMASPHPEAKFRPAHRPVAASASPTPSPTIDAAREKAERGFIKAVRPYWPIAADQTLLAAGYRTVEMLHESGSWPDVKAAWISSGMSDKQAGALVISAIVFLAPLEGYSGHFSDYE